MTFLFLDRVAGIVGEPDTLVSEARARIFKEPVRHEGPRRLPRDEVRAHVASVVVRVANDRLRQPLMDAVDAHAREAAETHAMMHGDDAPIRDAVIEAFAGNDVGIDMTVFGDGGATPEAVADQVLATPSDWMTVEIVTERAGVTREAIDGIVDEILTPAQVEWSLETLAVMCWPDVCEEGLRYLLCDSDPELRATGFSMLGFGADDAALHAWLDERAMFSSPESDEADVAEVLRLINEKGGDSHNGTRGTLSADAGNITAAGESGEEPSPAATLKVGDKLDVPGRGVHTITHIVPSEPSDVTRAVTAALKTLFDMTKETDVHMAEVLGVPKAVVAQARKDVTPWSPDAPQLAKLYGLVGRYNDALASAAGGLGALQPHSFTEEV